MSILHMKKDDVIEKLFGFGKKTGSSLFDKIKNFWKTNMKRY